MKAENPQIKAATEMNEPLEKLFEEHRKTAFFGSITSDSDKKVNPSTVMVKSYLTYGSGEGGDAWLLEFNNAIQQHLQSQ